MPSRKKNAKRGRSQNLAPLKPTFDLSDPISKKTATAMNTCGRSPCSNFKDFRSPSVANKRAQKRNRKYYNFSIVKPGQLGLDHYYENSSPWPTWPVFQSWPADKSQCLVVKMNKRQMFDEAKGTAPYPQYYCSCCHRADSARKVAERHEAAARAEADDWNKSGYHADFIATEDWIKYDYMGGGDAEDDYWAGPDEWDDDVIDAFAIDLAPFVDEAISKLNERVRVEIEAEGWADVSTDFVASPEMDWVVQSDRWLEKVEEFEMI